MEEKSDTTDKKENKKLIAKKKKIKLDLKGISFDSKVETVLLAPRKKQKKMFDRKNCGMQ